jgi:hypothetical protein
MIRIMFTLAFLVGAAAIMAMSWVFAGTDMLALAVTLLIALAYSIGAIELFQFHKATISLQSALQKLPGFSGDEQDSSLLSQWLADVPASLRYSVHSRIEGETKGLPSPVLTPYLVGLLVMLGLLGTFIGMVDTLQGSVIALQGSTELSAIRDGLAAPIKGLGLAFGTSVAGVAASAMLGLMSTLSRRERIMVARELDNLINTRLRHFSLNFNRQETYKALQHQARALPEVVHQLSQMASQLEAMSMRIEHTLSDRQAQFHEQAQQAYTQLAVSVGESLNSVLRESSGVIADAVVPQVERMVSQTQALLESAASAAQENIIRTQEQQLAEISRMLETTTQAVNENWQQGIDQTGQRLTLHLEKLEQTAESMQLSRQQTALSWEKAQSELQASIALQLQQAVDAMRIQEQQRADQAFNQLAQLETTAAEQLAALGASLEAPMQRLIETASHAPRAAADVISKLKQDMTDNLSRDNALLEERRRIMGDLERVSDSLAQSTLAQSQAMENLLQSSGEKLAAISERFEDKVASGMNEFASVARQINESTLDIASMSEGFVQAISQFSASNEQLVKNLKDIEAALNEAGERNNEQLAYYVAQARDIIDHSMLSQKNIIEDINQLILKQAELQDA